MYLYPSIWGRKWQPTPVFLPGKFHGQRSPPGYSLWVTKRRNRLVGHTYRASMCVCPDRRWFIKEIFPYHLPVEDPELVIPFTPACKTTTFSPRPSPLWYRTKAADMQRWRCFPEVFLQRPGAVCTSHASWDTTGSTCSISPKTEHRTPSFPTQRLVASSDINIPPSQGPVFVLFPGAGKRMMWTCALPRKGFSVKVTLCAYVIWLGQVPWPT